MRLVADAPHLVAESRTTTIHESSNGFGGTLRPRGARASAKLRRNMNASIARALFETNLRDARTRSRRRLPRRTPRIAGCAQRIARCSIQCSASRASRPSLWPSRRPHSSKAHPLTHLSRQARPICFSQGHSTLCPAQMLISMPPIQLRCHPDRGAMFAPTRDLLFE